MQKQRGFTLIELMIVIAIIAILATLGITNFSSALRRARDSKRQSDIIAMQKALETCNDVTRGIYIPSGDLTTNDWGGIVNYENANGCYNAPTLPPQVPNYSYYGAISNSQPQGFALCAVLENYAGNYTSGTARGANDRSVPGTITINGVAGSATGGTLTIGTNNGFTSITGATPCDPSSANNCDLFCVVNSQ